MAKSIVMATAATIDLDPEPIPRDWILSGAPEARSRKLARSHDWTSHIVIWDCTPGTFSWHYSMDEVVIFVSGEAFMTNGSGEERRFGAGDLGFFPAGSTCTWRVTEHIRKVGVLRETIWRPLGLGLKLWKKLLRMTGLTAQSPLMLGVAALALLRRH